MTGDLLRGLVRASTARPVLTVLASVALAAGGVAGAARALTFETSNLRLLPATERYAARFAEYLDDFGELNDIVVAIEAADPDEAKRYATRLVEELGTSAPAARVTSRVDPAAFEGRALLYLSVEQLGQLRDRLLDAQELIEAYAARPTLDELLGAVNYRIAAAILTSFFDLGLTGGAGTDLRFLERLLARISGALDGDPEGESPWTVDLAPARLERRDAGWFFSADRRLLFLFVAPRREAGQFTADRRTIEALRDAVARLRPEFPRVAAGVTGSPAISNDEMTTAFADSKRATGLALAATLGLLVLAFRQARSPLLMLGSLCVSLAWALGVITLTVGHLSIFSVMFISIVVGIGIDYGIYVLFRYEEERALGASLAEALAVTAGRAGPGILLGALTGAGTFFVLTLTRFRGIQEFGFVSGTAILMAFLAMVTLFPALLALADRGRAAANPGLVAAGEPLRARWLERLTARRATILAASVLVTAVSAWLAPGVGFTYSLLSLQAPGVESVAWEERILARAGRSGFPALASAGTPDELRDKSEAFRALPSVSSVESALMVVPDRQPEKLALIRSLEPLLPPTGPAAPPPADVTRLAAALDTSTRRLTLAATEAPAERRSDLERLRAQAEDLARRVRRAAPGRIRPGLDRLQAQLHRDFAEQVRRLRANLAPRPMEPGDAPPELRRRYVGRSGRFLIRIHPGVDIWDREGAGRFVADLRTVDADVTGAPVITYEAIGLMTAGYRVGTLYALALVAGLTALMFRRPRDTALALVPLALGLVWTLGAMRLAGLAFNLANVWALPLVVGTAAEYGIMMVWRHREARAGGGSLLARSAVLSVMLNGLTTMAGFGSLMIAHHRGIFGLGLLLTIGAGVSLTAALVVLPALIPAPPGSTRARMRFNGAPGTPRRRSARRARQTLPPG